MINEFKQSRSLAVFYFLIIGLQTGCEWTPYIPVSHDHQTLLLISLDGFAAEYRQLYQTPVLDSLAQNGVEAEALIPVYPTKTFPNHYTQVTGWYPGQHGIVSNRMYDSLFEEYFSLSDASVRDGKWYGGEPIWNTANKQGLSTATMFWPGSDACINGMRPDDYFVFNSQVSNETRILQVVEWLSREDRRPHFVSLYLESIDRAGHLAGPHSPLVKTSVEAVDKHIGSLCETIRDLRLSNVINIVIISDHGMAKLDRDRVIFLDDYLDLEQVEIVNWSPVLELIPKESEPDKILQCLAAANEPWQVFLSKHAPTSFIPVNNHRIPPVIALANPGWSITSREFYDEHPEAFKGGTHGYDPGSYSMKGILIASGVSIQSGVQLPQVSSVDLYELWCSLLKISPSPNSGDPQVWQPVLKF